MIIQSPEMFAHKDAVARRNIGRHLLVGLSCKNGIVFARRIHDRSPACAQGSNRTPKWASTFDNRIITASIGDFGGVQEVLSDTSEMQSDLSEIITNRYVTAKVTEDAVRTLMRVRYEQEPLTYGAHVLIASLDRPHEFSFVDFRGKIKHFANFAIAGGELDSPETKVAKGGAIEYVAQRCARNQNQSWQPTGMAMRILRKVFANFDPPGANSKVEYLLISRGVARCIRE